MRLVLGTTALMVAFVAVVLLWFDGPAEFIAYQVVLLLLAVVAIRRIRPANGTRGTASPRRLRTKQVRRPDQLSPPQLERIERLVGFSKTAAFDAEWRLLPVLRSIAAEQLVAHHGVDLAASPDRARQLLGADGWRLLDPDRELPEDRLAPGLSLEQLDTAVTAIESL